MSNVEICQVAYEGRISRLKALLETNPKLISVADQNCRQPLHWACSGGHRDVVAFILNCCLAIEGTIDVNTPDDAEYTPLHIATSSGHLHIVILLIQTGYCDVNSITNQDQTALYFAASKNWIEITEVLLASHADPNICNNLRSTPLHKAAQKEHLQIVKMLLDAGAYINAKDIDGNTALHLACEANHIRTINFLIERDAKRDVVNKLGKKPLDLCNPTIRGMVMNNIGNIHN